MKRAPVSVRYGKPTFSREELLDLAEYLDGSAAKESRRDLREARLQYATGLKLQARYTPAPRKLVLVALTALWLAGCGVAVSSEPPRDEPAICSVGAQ